ncbi:uncharacterized protein PHALS_02054 [Plasmopara halstedii]|uniref:Uncharacterized protein n=1 Tax=Plasmopara halstedii TaxID=4781 RepID=A0A0P1AWD8_PLAHL|nr:uncharacterized protein PHALS_02054 [Plasmopara halstedii]CEG45781.1 hypothetical protein PHALS_02054 [Plasmopara halstedii]|eukprot:XP_024582150.1 hypothetical protein PHALS_02054 [Plasmopara halstedii]
MRLPNTSLEREDHTNQEKHETSNSKGSYEQLYVNDGGLISFSHLDPAIELDKAMSLLERRELEVRQAAEYGLGLLEDNEELQMEVATLKIQLETETKELTEQRDMWKSQTEHLQQEMAQWKRKCARVEDELTDLAKEFEHFVDCCQCHGSSSATRYSESFARLQTELQELNAVKRSNEAELSFLRQRKEVAEQKHQEALECEALATRSEVSYRKTVEIEFATSQRVLNDVKNEKNQLSKLVQNYEAELKELKKQLRCAEAKRDDTLLHNNELSEALLSSESRCKRFQRELELLEHVSYFAQASVDRDDEESDVDDETIKITQAELAKCSNKPLDSDSKIDTARNTSDDEAVQSPIRSKRRRPLLMSTISPNSSFSSNGKISEAEIETQKKLYHYFHLTALSIINENNLHERCFNSSSRVTIDMWYREVMSKDVPFLLWHSWLIKRISDVAASDQIGDNVLNQPSTSTFKGSKITGFCGFSLRKSSNTDSENSLPSSTTPPAAPPVVRVPFTVARAFFSLLRKNTHPSAGLSLIRKVSIDGSPAG